ncbi:MAG: response regulator [Clostridia bacterium]|nr:response regulator [Clostridia bacterium]
MTDKEGDWINCVFVINKEPEEQKHIREILKNAAIEITCVTSIGYTIIELSKKKFDFIILDASFTETDGSALIDALQENTQIPILILSLRAGKDTIL